MLQRRHLSYSILALGAVACGGDSPATGPGRLTLGPPSFQTISPPGGTVTLTPTASNQGIPEQTVVSYAEQTIVTVHASGTMQMTNNNGGSAGTLDASGIRNSGNCTANVWIAFTNFVGFCASVDGPHAPRDPFDTTTLVQGGGRVAWIRGPYTGSNFCDGAGQPACYTFTGGPFTVTITPVTVDFNVTASPATVNYNDSVTVTATVSPGQVAGVAVPWRIDSTTWAPAFGTEASPCTGTSWVAPDAGTRTCRRPFTRSGTLTVFATVNGVKAQKALGITVTPPTLKVTAAPPTIQGPNSVTFTATVTPSSIPYNSWSLSGWTWTPNNGGASPCNWYEKTCSRMVSRTGWMKATATIGGYALTDSAKVTVTPPVLKVTSAPKSIIGSQSVTFTATVTPSPPNGWNLSQPWAWTPDSGTGGISAICQWYEKTCTRTISKSGWMKATTVIGEYTLTDSAHVSVVPCLTGDSLLDDSRIRRALNNAMNGSNPNGSPWDRRERGGARIRRPDGSVADTLYPIGPNDTPCSFYFPSNLGGQGLVGWHIHPFMPKDKNDPLPYDPNQTPHSNCPQIANAPPPPFGGVFTLKPGPSSGDLTLTGGVPHIIVDKATVWVIDPSGAETPFPRNQPGKCDALRL